MFLGKNGGGSRLSVDVIHVFQQGHRAAEVLLYDGQPVDCVDKYLASFGAAGVSCGEGCGRFVGDWTQRFNPLTGIRSFLTQTVRLGPASS